MSVSGSDSPSGMAPATASDGAGGGTQGSVAIRRGPFSALYSGNIRSVFNRGLMAAKGSTWVVWLSGFFEPVLYLLAMGIGMGALVGSVVGPGGQEMPYAAYIAPALLAVSAMNGAVFDSTWNVFFKMQYARLYQAMLSTSLGPLDVAFGEIFLALFRGLLYATGFTAVMGFLGLLVLPWGLLLIPASLIIAFAFASVGMAITSYMKTFQQMDWINFVMLPMFLFSATFFPITVYPEAVQWFIMAMPLWHGVELLRGISVGEFGGIWVHLCYFAVMIAGGLALTTARLRALFLR